MLDLDVRVLRELRGVAGFPQLLDVGRTELYKFCIMELVGVDLSRLRYVFPEWKWARGSTGEEGPAGSAPARPSALVVKRCSVSRLSTASASSTGGASPGKGVSQRRKG